MELGTHGFYNNLSHHQEQVAQSFHAEQANSHGVNPKGRNLGNFFNDRMAAIMQQLSQYTDLSSLTLHRANLVDATKAKKVHDFMEVTNSQMEAATLQADFKAANSYLAIS